MSTLPPEAPVTIAESAAMILSELPIGADKETFGVMLVGTNLKDLVEQHGAVVECRQAGGTRTAWQEIARIQIGVYAATEADAWTAQRAVEARLADRWQRAPEGALRLDQWRNESAAAPQMFPDLRLIVSTWRVSTRQLD